jgi:carbonic anhydrase
MAISTRPAGTPVKHSSEYARALAENKRYASGFDRSKLGMPPGRKLAVVACMDARLTVEDILGLRSGDAHIIRNAGGLATDDAIRSLVISQQLLGTEEVIVIEHTDCGMLTFQDEAVRRELATRTGSDVDLPLRPFGDLRVNLLDQLARLRSHPWIKDVPIHGLIYQVETGLLLPVE